MKRVILTLIIAVISTAGFSQYDISANIEDTVSTETGSFYVATGISIGNTSGSKFQMTSYPSVEVGFMKGNFAIGLVAGRGNFDFSTQDNISNYWYSLKGAAYFPIGKSNLDGYGLLAIGNYMNTDQFFIEYGVGMSYTFKSNLGVFGQVSNWDGIWYITPGLSYSF